MGGHLLSHLPHLVGALAVPQAGVRFGAVCHHRCTTCSTCPSPTSARILDRSPGAAKQLASRARRKVRRAQPASDTDAIRQRAVVVFAFTVTGATITAIDILASPDVIQQLDITIRGD